MAARKLCVVPLRAPEDAEGKQRIEPASQPEDEFALWLEKVRLLS
jgi:hypothetical protein